MHYFGCLNVIQSPSTNIFEIVTVLATLAALGTAIYQSIVARRSLEAATKAINEDTRSRQISMLPKMSWVIEVQIRIDAWLADLEKIKDATLNAVQKKDGNIIQALAKELPKNTKDLPLGIQAFVYTEMPDALREIMMSGAQYYYNAAAPAAYLWKDKEGPNWDYALSIQDRFDESIAALKKLRNLIKDIVPDVILETPASISSKDFISK